MATLRALVIAGGGGGGNSQGGGGGAGGFQDDSSVTIEAIDYAVTVGQGGSQSDSGNPGSTGYKGGDSSIGSIVVSEGGGGGGIHDVNGDGADGADGGSGGGGAGADNGDSRGWYGSGTAGQGNNGGYGNEGNSLGPPNDDDATGGGGGGAGGAGQNGGDNAGGNGGAEASSDISGTSTSYAGGGGGNGPEGTGSGHTSPGSGGNALSPGQDGLVVVRYPTADFGVCSGGTKTTDGTDTIHTFTSDGTLSIVLNPELNNAPTVSNVQGTTLEAEGDITSVSNEDCDTRGFVLSTTSQSNPGDTDPDSSDYSIKSEETGAFSTGTFSLLVSGLTGNTVYYLRAYAKNSGGYTYSDEIQVITNESSPAVSLQTDPVTSIAEETATGNAEINDVGDSNATERGFVWGDESVTLPGNVAPEVTGYTNDSQSNGDFTAGTFTGTLTDLKRGRKYYVRAWAKNEVGYRYGNEVSFTTLDNNNDDIASTTLTNEDTSSVSLTNET